jgi:hypothetical protein
MLTFFYKKVDKPTPIGMETDMLQDMPYYTTQKMGLLFFVLCRTTRDVVHHNFLLYLSDCVNTPYV